jgi:4-hydroxy-2-oxoheptanedioate aldolase
MASDDLGGLAAPGQAQPGGRGRAAAFARRVRGREPIVGYWVTLDAPPATERIARLGYDYVCLDGQHGLLGYSGLLAGLTAIDAAGSDTVGLVRVGSNDPFQIGQALDAGAAGIIVPLVDTADEASRAVAAATYPPNGIRSYGPMRAALRIGPRPAESDASVVVLAMIETAQGLASVEEICAVPGLTGIYVGPYDLRLGVGGAHPTDPAVQGTFDAAVARVAQVAARAGVCAGIHTFDGASAARRLEQGFTLATVSCDLVHLEHAAAEHLRVARERP